MSRQLEAKPTSIRLWKSDREKLVRYARAEDRDLATLIRIILSQWLVWKAEQEKK